MLDRRLGALLRPAGSRPGGRVPSFVSPKEGTKKRRPRPRRSACSGLLCGARTLALAQNSLRALRALRSDSCAKSVNEGASRRAKVLRSSTPPTGPEEQHQPHLAAHRLAGRCAASRVASRRRRREAQGFAAGRASAPRHLTSRGCLSAAPAGRVASSARGCKDRASQRTPRTARGDAFGSPLLGHFFWRDRRSDSPAGASPGLLQHRAETSIKHTTRTKQRFDKLRRDGAGRNLPPGDRAGG